MTLQIGAKLDLLKAKASIESYKPIDPVAAYTQENMVRLIEKSADCASRYFFDPGHFTAQAFLINPDLKAVGLMHHKKLNLWCGFGGHIEPEDNSFLDAAFRETREESGIQNVQLIDDVPFDLDIHGFPARGEGMDAVPDHLHYDVRYLFQAHETAFNANDESLAIEWVPFKDLSTKMGWGLSNARVIRAIHGRFGQ